MNTIAAIQRINEAELQSGLALNISASWHAKYLNSAWCYVGNLPHVLTEGDVICILSQFGEIEDINLVRDEETGKSKGFSFVKYEDSRSCVLAVDNLCGSKILGRSIRVDHVEKYRLPKHLLEKELQENNQQKSSYYGNNDPKENNQEIHTNAGHAYQRKEIKGPYDIHSGQDLFTPVPIISENRKDSKNSLKGDNISIDSSKKKEDKRLRKEARAQIRKEREEKRQKREERKRKKRAKYLRADDHNHYGNDDDVGFSKYPHQDDKSITDGDDEKRRKHARKYKRHHRKHKSSRSRSRSKGSDSSQD